METYYHPADLGKFAEMGKGNKELWEKFQNYYAAVFREGALTEREKALRERFEKMRSELNLPDQQTTAVRAILEETRNEYRALKTELRPRFEEPRLKARTRIRALLTPEQQQKFDAMMAQHDAQRDEEQKARR